MKKVKNQVDLKGIWNNFFWC